MELLSKPVTFSGKASGSVNQSWHKLLKGFLEVFNNYHDRNAVWIFGVVFLRFVLSFSFNWIVKCIQYEKPFFITLPNT